MSNFVYLISHPAFPDAVKVGVTNNLKHRLSCLRVAVPDRAHAYQFIGLPTQHGIAYDLERATLKHFKHPLMVGNGEWILRPIPEVRQFLRSQESIVEDSWTKSF